MAPAFVGRDAELALLDDIYLRAKREERPAAALMTGLPGSGKTRLLAEFRRRQGASPQLNVGGYQTGAQVPLAAAGDLLRTLVNVPGAGRKLEEALFGATTSDERPLEPLRIFEAAHRAARFDVGHVFCSDAACSSRSTRYRILPTALIGSVSRMSTDRGTL